MQIMILFCCATYFLLWKSLKLQSTKNANCDLILLCNFSHIMKVVKASVNKIPRIFWFLHVSLIADVGNVLQVDWKEFQCCELSLFGCWHCLQVWSAPTHLIMLFQHTCVSFSCPRKDETPVIRVSTSQRNCKLWIILCATPFNIGVSRRGRGSMNFIILTSPTNFMYWHSTKDLERKCEVHI